MGRKMLCWVRRGMAALLALVLAGWMTVPAFAGGGDPWPWEEPAAQTGLITPTEDMSKLECRSAILVEQSTGRVLYEKEADLPLAPASITKVMTLLLTFEALERGELQYTDLVTCSLHANSMGGTQIWLEVGEQMTVEDLIKAVAVGSANDAAVALAEHLAGSENAFVDQMNQRAAQLGMNGTCFKNASGLDEEGHLTTARDIAMMSRQLMTHPEVAAYTSIWMDTLRGGETQLVNTNRLIRFYKGATGLKTGTTDGAGHCLAATATRGQLGLIAVTLGSSSSDARFSSAWSLLDYGFDHYQALPVPELGEQLVPVKVLGGVEESLMPLPQPPDYLLVRREEAGEVTQAVYLPEDLQAPVEQGQQIGRVELSIAGQPAGEYPLVAGEGVAELTLGRAWSLLWQRLFFGAKN